MFSRVALLLRFTLLFALGGGLAQLVAFVPAAAADAPQLALSESEMDFGTVPVGGTIEQTVAVTNTGTDGLQLSNVSFSIPPGVSTSFDLDPAYTSCPNLVLAAGASCTITVRVTPGQAESLAGVALLIQGGAASTQWMVPLLGSVGSGVAQPSSSVVNLGATTPGAPVVGSVMLTNPGAADLNITGVGTPLAPFNSQVSGTCAGTLPAGGSCMLTVSVAPAVSGLLLQQVTVQYANGMYQPLQLFGSSAFGLPFAPLGGLSFGGGGGGGSGGSGGGSAPTSRTLTVANTTGAPLVVQQVSYTSPGGAVFTTNLNGSTCLGGAVIAPGASCTIVVQTVASSPAAFTGSVMTLQANPGIVETIPLGPAQSSGTSGTQLLQNSSAPSLPTGSSGGPNGGQIQALTPNGPSAPNPAATPELNSLILLTTGVAGAAGYALLSIRRRGPRQ